MPIYNYNTKKKKLIESLIKFNETDDLIQLANVLIMSKEILLTNRFPIGKYKKWIKTNQLS